MRRLLYLFLFLSAFPLAAQPGSQTEASIQREAEYIAAKREALLGKTEKAIALFKELIESEPDNDALQFELGRLQHADGDTEAAIEALKKAYDRRPSEVYAAFLAELYQASGQYSDGAELYAGLIKSNPGTEGYYLERAAFLVRAQDIKGAVDVYNQLENRIGVNAELTRLKHALYLGQGDTKRAEKELLNLIDAQPGQLTHRHLLAGFYVSQGAYGDILKIEPADVRAQLALQDVLPGGTTAAAGNDDELLRLLGRTDVDIDLKIGKILPLVQQLARTQDAEEGQRAMALAAELRRVHPDEAKAAAMPRPTAPHWSWTIPSTRFGNNCWAPFISATRSLNCAGLPKRPSMFTPTGPPSTYTTRWARPCAPTSTPPTAPNYSPAGKMAPWAF